MEVENRPLQGVSADVHEKGGRIDVSVGETPDQYLTHGISAPTHVRFLQTEFGADEGLEIVSRDGTRTIISFRAPIRPEMLDGKVA